MKLWDHTWMQVEKYLEHDDRVVVPLGSTEQHAYLSVGTDAILCEKGAVEAARSEGVPVLPVLPFGLTPLFTAFPGTVSLRMATYVALLTDVLDALYAQGFRRIVLLSGHGGNAPAAQLGQEWGAAHADAEVMFHGWFTDPRVWSVATGLAEAGHASWVENFADVRIDGVGIPAGAKPLVPPAALRTASPEHARELLGDGSGGGAYQLEQHYADKVWATAVTLLREQLSSGWNARK
ncbi:creatininase family protein [Amycolatopsis panacis]|uniref:Creatininase family protein n=1 Tax=Amycolatopsis panacis TaxID=2340917 RepID=A0A419HJD6_9PSEU|nr:creatininase family protein [Amycolatopsis panacis]RJQ75913.1 creatininase family protein [Amycolatopsis panacis]